MKRIGVALSGGVDSAVVAALLLEKKYEVFGATMVTRDPEGSDGGAAARVAACLGIEHHVVDLREIFTKTVIDSFVQAYRCGETPNPCIRCNAHIKFGVFLEAVRELGADAMATGHYAQVARCGVSGRFSLERGADRLKDQSYMLYALTQDQLGRIIFPLGAMSKEEVRAEARRLGVWDAVERKESQDICFVGNGRGGSGYADFIVSRGGALQPGVFVDKQGRVLGSHPGIERFTVGQRKGLGIALGERVFVVGIDPVQREIILGKENDVFMQELWADRLNWIFWENCNEFLPGIHVQAKIRYHAPAVDAQLYCEAGMIRVAFAEAQRAVAPGQAVVFYQGDVLLGGGRIVSDIRGIRQDLVEGS
ncbi:MAG: tRNA 2-thiouridine(34) synthase MnmA [Peptococcaceae bacterium]|nr:tRNA 2-thiouridine(34) synthase MnmA [Peptococcaceae bacterium]